MCTFMVRPILEYAATVWSPHLQYQKQQINKVQCSAARFVTNDFSYYSSVSTMLDHLKWPCPYLNSKKYLKLICYKMLHGMVEVPITLTPNLCSSRGHSQRFVAPLAELRHFSLIFTIYHYSVELSTQLTG